jgi:hypothetical protein
MLKSYHSMALPATLAAITRRRSFPVTLASASSTDDAETEEAACAVMPRLQSKRVTREPVC